MQSPLAQCTWEGRLSFFGDEPDDWQMSVPARAWGWPGDGCSPAVADEMRRVGKLPLLPDLRFEDYVEMSEFFDLAEKLETAFWFSVQSADERFKNALQFWDDAGRVPQTDLAALPVAVFVVKSERARQRFQKLQLLCDAPDAVGLALYTMRDLSSQQKKSHCNAFFDSLDWTADPAGALEDPTVFEAAIVRIEWEIQHNKKTVGLKRCKSLQGKIWQEGYSSGAIKEEVYEDVPQAIGRWVEKQVSVYIYSSGSVHVQQLLFGHSTADT
eukprot:tig00021720_g23186.t1